MVMMSLDSWMGIDFRGETLLVSDLKFGSIMCSAVEV